MRARQTIDVELRPEQALALVEASFEAAGGWTVEPRGEGLLIYTDDPLELLDPRPEVYTPQTVISTLALRVDARAPGVGVGGLTGSEPVVTRVSAHFVRRRLGALAGAFVLDLVGITGIPLFYTALGVMGWFEHRRARRDGRRRVLRLAIEPLMPHQCRGDRGPFRRPG